MNSHTFSTASVAPLKDDEVRPLFPGTATTVFLNTASMALGAAAVRDAYARALDQWVAGRFDFPAADLAGEESRQLFAELIGTSAQNVAIVPSVSAAAGTIAAQLDAPRPGQNIVVGAEEFASNYFPWLMLRERGYEVRVVPFIGGGVTTDALAASIDSGTRLVALSAVQSSSGVPADLRAAADLVHAAGGWLFVDASQAVGAVPIDVRETDLDFLATTSHKFLCGTRGMGYLFARPEIVPTLRPVSPGWKAARVPNESFYGPTMDLSPTASRVDASLTWFAAVGEREALGLLDRLGPARIFERNRMLMRRLCDGLAAQRLAFPEATHVTGSTVLSLPTSDPNALMERFAAERVKASLRAGRVRLSVHFYNTVEEIDLVVRLLAGA